MVVNEGLTQRLCYLRGARVGRGQLVKRLTEVLLNILKKQDNVWILLRSPLEVLCHIQHRDRDGYTARLNPGGRRSSGIQRWGRE